jgi:excisionase family DNA binding protein
MADKLAYTARELASLLGVSPKQVIEWAHQGLIPAKQPAGKGGRVIFPAGGVEKWLEKLDAGPTSLRMVAGGKRGRR